MTSRRRGQSLFVTLIMALGLAATLVQPAAAAHDTGSGSYDASGKNMPNRQPAESRANQQPAETRSRDNLRPECPPQLLSKCQFVSAAYASNNPDDATDYGNFDVANRPADGTKISGVTLHDIEGPCESAIDHFRNPTSYVSSHYVICADGRIIQMVRLKDIAWTAGNWWYNSRAVQIEHAGYASRPQGYTDAMYSSSIQLVRWLGQKYGFPLNRATVHGHDNVPGVTDDKVPGQHVDPGPFWNWEQYMNALSAPLTGHGELASTKLVTIAPSWSKSREIVTGCNVSSQKPPPCVPPGSYPTNFVYLRTQPSATAPFITDLLTGPGSTHIENRSARAFYGMTYALADRRVTKDGTWYKIWFGGQGGWFLSPHDAPNVKSATGQCATPKSNRAISVYGRPLPELSEWDIDFTPPPGSQPAPKPLSYKMQPGQCYTVIDKQVQAEHHFVWTHDDTLPRFRVTGKTVYVQVVFNGRHAFVKKSDVSLK